MAWSKVGMFMKTKLFNLLKAGMLLIKQGVTDIVKRESVGISASKTGRLQMQTNSKELNIVTTQV